MLKLYKKLSKLDTNKMRELKEAGAKTFKDALLMNRNVLAAKKIVKKNEEAPGEAGQVKNEKAAEEPIESEELIKDNISVSAFAEFIGSEVYKKTYEKDGKT